MELGKGEWDLEILRSRYIQHMDSYERVLVLRCLSQRPSQWHYELVEIPKPLLLEAKTGQLQTQEKSKQTPKPGHCYIKESDETLKYQLYFDGGTERKLQVQHIKKSLCFVHAYWMFCVDT
jgi:type II restriction enzyme